MKSFLLIFGTAIVMIGGLCAALFFWPTPICGRFLSISECLGTKTTGAENGADAIPAQEAAVAGGCCNTIDDNQDGLADCDDVSCGVTDICAIQGTTLFLCTGADGKNAVVGSEKGATVCAARKICEKYWMVPTITDGMTTCSDGTLAQCWYGGDSDVEAKKYEGLAP